MSRCGMVVETFDGEFRRCNQMTYGEGDTFCYYHTKVADGLTSPDTTYDIQHPDRPIAYYKKGIDKPLRIVDNAVYGERHNGAKATA